MIDWLYRTFAPVQGLRRVQARKAMDVHKRFYDAASKKPGRFRPWHRKKGTANAVMQPHIRTLMATSRDLVRNSSWAKKAVNTHANAIVGKGIIPRPDTGNDALDRQIQQAFSDWCGEADSEGFCTFYGLQLLAVKTMLQSGTVLGRRWTRKNPSGIPLEVQLLEPDQLNHELTATNKENDIYNGIELNPRGRPVAYHLYRRHPDDFHSLNARRNDSTRVPAEAVAHCFIKDRPGQLLGEPYLTTAAITIRDLDDYEQSELVRKKVEACFAAFVTQPEGGDRAFGGDGEYIEPTEESGRFETVSPGMIQYLDPGEQVQFGSPQQLPGYPEYVRSQLHKIAAGLDMHYSQLSGDLSAVNYSSYRAGDIVYRGSVVCFRTHHLIPMFCVPFWRWIIDAAIAAGRISAADHVYRAKWTPPAFTSVDPEKDAKATNHQIRMRTKTLSEAIREGGGEPSEVLQEAANDVAKLEELELISDAEPSHMTRTGASISNGNKDSAEERDNARNDD
jgi:lambda family phage portal protein